MKQIFQFLVAVVVSLSAIPMVAQEASQASTPFPYPQAPDTCTTLESRTNYVVTHFWDNYDFSRPIEEGNREAFVQAFQDYVSFFPHAHRNVVLASIRDFIFKAQVNADNMLKITQVAEVMLYSPYAVLLSDEAYVPFATAMARNDRMTKEQKNYFKQQVARINLCQPGNMIPDLELVDAQGNETKLSEIPAKCYLLIFTDDDANSSIARVRLGTEVTLNQIIDSGEITVIDIRVGKADQQWREKVASFPSNWKAYCCETALRDIDVRFLPSCFIVGGDMKLINKNVRVDAVLQSL